MDLAGAGLGGIRDVESLLVSAGTRGRVLDMEGGAVRDALERLVQCISLEAGLREPHARTTERMLCKFVATRSAIRDVQMRYPELLKERIERPIFITGLLRTGSTLLHNLLATQPELRAPLYWEMDHPILPFGHHGRADSEDPRAAIAESAHLLERFFALVPKFRSIHPMNVHWPDECSHLFRYMFFTMLNGFSFRIPSYVEWAIQADARAYYREYRSYLQLLQWGAGSRRWVLKDPCHLWHLDALLEVFPDAQVILLHRRLDQTLPSMASLFFALQEYKSFHSDPRTMAAYSGWMAKLGLSRMLAVRDGCHARRIHDIFYSDLLADPLEVIGSICEAVGVGVDSAGRRSAAAWLEENRQAPGRHGYTLGEFGFDAGSIAREFQDYQDRFFAGARI